MKKSALDMRSIVARASVRISARDYTPLELRGIVRQAKNNSVCITDANILSTLDIKSIARCGRVMFEFA